jgi:hypothetical protein
MKFSELNYGLLNKKVKLKSLKQSKLQENDVIVKGKIYKIFDIAKDYFKKDKKTVELIDENMNVFWVNQYDIDIVED